MQRKFSIGLNVAAAVALAVTVAWLGKEFLSRPGPQPAGPQAAPEQRPAAVFVKHVPAQVPDVASRVQAKTANGASTSSLSLALTSNATACNLLTLSLSWTDSPTRTASVSDNQGNTWALILQTDNGSGAHLATFKAPDIAGGSTTITVTFSGSVTHAAAIATEWAGAAPVVNCVDQSLGTTGATGNPASGNVTTGQSNELLYAVSSSLGSQTLTAGTGWTGGTSASSGTSIDLQDEWRDSAAGTYNGNWTGGGSIAWLAQTVTFIETTSSAVIGVDTYADGGGSNTWDLTNPTVPQILMIGPQTSNVLKCQFNAADFSATGSLTGVLVEFDVKGLEDMGDTPTVNSVKISLGSIDLSDSASLPTTFATFSYGGSCQTWNLATTSGVNGAWEIDLKFQTNAVSGEQTTITVQNAKATVYTYTPLPPNVSAGAVSVGVEVDAPTPGRFVPAGVVQVDGAFVDAAYGPGAGSVSIDVEVDEPGVTIAGTDNVSVRPLGIGVEVDNTAVVLGSVSPSAGTVAIGTTVTATNFASAGVVEIGTVVRYEPLIIAAGVVNVRVAPAAPLPREAPGVAKVGVAVVPPSVISGVQFPGAAAIGVEVDSPSPSLGRTAGVVNVGVETDAPLATTTIATPGTIGVGVSFADPRVTVGPVSATAGTVGITTETDNLGVGGVVVTAGVPIVGVVVATASQTTQSPGAVNVGVSLLTPQTTVFPGVVSIGSTIVAPAAVSPFIVPAGVVTVGVQVVGPTAYPVLAQPLALGVAVASPGVTLGGISQAAGAVAVGVDVEGSALVWAGAPQINVGVAVAGPTVALSALSEAAGTIGVGVEGDNPAVTVSAISKAAGTVAVGVETDAPGVAPDSQTPSILVGVSVASPTVSAATSVGAGAVAVGLGLAPPAVAVSGVSESAGAAAVGVEVDSPVSIPQPLSGSATIGVSFVSPSVSAATSIVSGAAATRVEVDAPAVAVGAISEAAGTVAVGVAVVGPGVPPDYLVPVVSIGVAVAGPTVSLGGISPTAGVVNVGLALPLVSVSSSGLSASPSTDTIGVSAVGPSVAVGTASPAAGHVEIGVEVDSPTPAISGTATVAAPVVSIAATASIAVPSAPVPATRAWKKVTWIPESRGTLWILPKRSPRVVV